MAAHLSALAAIAGIPFGHVLGPLIVYLVKGRESQFVGEHAKASLNYQITLSILVVVAIFACIALSLGYAANSTADNAFSGAAVTFGVLWFAIAIAAVVLLLLSIVFIIMGTVTANEGRPYTYPFAIRFLR